MTTLNNNALNAFNAPSGKACLRYTGNAALNANLSSTGNVRVCRAAGSTVSGGAGFGAASVTVNCASCSVALPVHLQAFTAVRENAGVRLRWSTAGEWNNSYFVVQRSGDGNLWNDIGRVTGAGTTSVETFYDFFDPAPGPAKNQYRLQQVDANGLSVYSAVVTASALTSRSAALVFPNPNHTSVIGIQGIKFNGNTRLCLTDLQGRIIFQKTIISPTLRLPALRPGLYTLAFQHTQTGEIRYEKYRVL